jgi:hypothetical protein
MEQPQIIAALCDYLTCTRLDPNDETLYLVVDHNVQCGTEEYNLFRNIMVIPSLAVWGFVVPLIIFLVLSRKREKLLKSRSLYIVFGNLYNNYKLEAFFWGIIIIVFEITMFVLNSVLRNYNLGRGVALVLIVHIYYILYNKYSPHPSKDQATADKIAIRSFMWTLYFILIRNEILASNPNNKWVGILLDAIILIVNSLIVCYFILRIGATALKKHTPTIRKMMTKLASLRQKKKGTQNDETQSPEKHTSGIDLMPSIQR